MENIKDDKYFVDKILECISIIEDISKGKDIEELEQNVLLNNTIMFQFSLIGEYSGRLSEEYKNKKPNIPWSSIKGFRNNIIHNYDGVIYSRVEQTIKVDVPNLKKDLLENEI